MKYTIKDFQTKFPTDAACLTVIFNAVHPEGASCPKCSHKDSYYPLSKRRAYVCSRCGHHIYPTAGTIFHKSPTALSSWFFAMFLMATSKNGVSAKELQRQVGVTYKCAWRMAHQIRQLMQQDGEIMTGIVEADETYVGGKDINKHANRRQRRRGRAAGGKTPVVGVLERGGNVSAKVVEDVGASSIMPHLMANVREGSLIATDEWQTYKVLPHFGYQHATVNHKDKEFVKGVAHTNSIEGFWSQLKRSINGTFHQVSPKHLQKYVNEFAYRYNRRKSATPMFVHLLSGAAGRHAPAV
jgi:transposase-like protein/DNA-directed RNA polymerase subunit RPC12/RpoP